MLWIFVWTWQCKSIKINTRTIVLGVQFERVGKICAGDSPERLIRIWYSGTTANWNMKRKVAVRVLKQRTRCQQHPSLASPFNCKPQSAEVQTKFLRIAHKRASNSPASRWVEIPTCIIGFFEKDLLERSNDTSNFVSPLPARTV